MHDLLQILLLEKSIQVTNITILGDLLIIIQHLHSKTWPKGSFLENLLKRIKVLLDEFSHKYFFHILRDQSIEADKRTNCACHLKDRKLEINGAQRW